jgi:hypothetical protein
MSCQRDVPKSRQLKVAAMPPAGRQHTNCSIYSPAISAPALALFLDVPREEHMIRTYLTAASSAAALAVSVIAFAQQGQLGTADEAKAQIS